jgi:hypothetical protein
MDGRSLPLADATSRRAPAWRSVLLALLWLVIGEAAQADTLIVGPSGQPAAFAQTLARAREGDVIEVLPGEYCGVVAVITQRRLTIRGVGERPVFVADGKAAEGKAIFVVQDGDITIENLEFRGVRVTDQNGAGIRFEKGHLRVRGCAFLDNEIGLLTANDGAAELEIRDSEFGRAPHIEGSLPHLLYVGRIGKVTIVGSRFHRGYEGHLVKSRARESVITYNMIRDTGEGSASYEIDLPNGGVATIIGNVVGQSPSTQNPVLISYGEEGAVWDRNELVLAHNTLISEGWTPGWFLRVWRDLVPMADEPLLVNNLVVGSGIFWLGVAGYFEGNWPATLGMLRDVTTMAFELPPDSWLRGRGVDPRHIRGRDLAPRAEFEWPLGTREISTDRQRWSPGAYQR